jgi:predicted double-glycine peptidase
MADLYLGIGALMLLMIGMFFLALWLTRRAPALVCDVLASLTVVGIAVFARWVWEQPVMARLLPFSNLIIVSNWFPLAAGFLAGLVWRRIGDKPERIPGVGSFEALPRRIFATGVLAAAGLYAAMAPLVGRPPLCHEAWDGDLCLQTSPATCSAAAAATLLQYYGVYAPEQELADLCLTRRGTNWKGLYRGLTLKAAPLGLRVEVLDTTIDDLARTLNEPCILLCELEVDNYEASGEYERAGWVPGQPHSVVLWDIVGDQYLVADPAAGVELWTRQALETLWQGQALRMTVRGSVLTSAS